MVERWDAVVVATAWYDNPKWPDTPGLEKLKENGIARHAREWKGPGGVRAFKNKVCSVRLLLFSLSASLRVFHKT